MVVHLFSRSANAFSYVKQNDSVLEVIQNLCTVCSWKDELGQNVY